MSKINWPKLKQLYGIDIEISPFVGDDKLILIGKEEYKSPTHFSRQLSIMDLKTGKVSGNVHEGEVQKIHVSQLNYDKFKAVTEVSEGHNE